jgi:hypothetical protein
MRRAAMPILPSEVIAQTVQVLEEVCLLLDDEIDETRRDPNELPDKALKLADALQAVHQLIPKLQMAKEAMVASNSMQTSLWSNEPHDSGSHDAEHDADTLTNQPNGKAG